MHPTTIGLDLAKHVFQVHGVDVAGKVIIRKKLRRSELKAFFEKLPPCLVGMEACGTAHYWGRELSSLGHHVRLMILMLHRTRDLFVRQRTMLVNSLRGQLAEFGLIAPQGIWRRRHFAAWIGLVPQQNGTGGKVHLGRISKKGEPYLRRLLVLGATAVVRYARDKPEFAGWVNALLARRPARVVTVAVANKLARIVWAIMRRGGSFRQRPLGIA